MSLKTSNIYSAETYDYFSRTINMKEKLCNMSHDNEKTTEDSATEKANLEKAKEKKEAEEAKKRAPLEKKLAKMQARKDKLQDPNRPNISDYAGQLTPDLQKAVANNNIVNAPSSVVNANSSSNTTTSTPVRQPNMVIGMLSAST